MTRGTGLRGPGKLVRGQSANGGQSHIPVTGSEAGNDVFLGLKFTGA